MNDSALNEYLTDLVTILKEKAFDAKIRKETCNKNDKEYYLGYLMAYFEVISLMKSQAEVFQIETKLVGLKDINPEVDLL